MICSMSSLLIQGGIFLGIDNSSSMDALIALLLLESLRLGSFSVLKWAKVIVSRCNTSFWKMFILIYCYRNAENLFVCMDVETNPGFNDDNFRCMHCNLNSIVADLSRISLIRAYNAINDFHIISITESALKKDISDDTIDIPGYIPIRNDLPGDDTHGGVLIWHKIGLAVKNRTDIFTILTPWF